MRLSEILVILLCAFTLAVEASHLSSNLARRGRERERERPQETRISMVRHGKTVQRFVF